MTKTTCNPHERKQMHTYMSAEDHDKLDVPVLVWRLRIVGMGSTVPSKKKNETTVLCASDDGRAQLDSFVF